MSCGSDCGTLARLAAILYAVEGDTLGPKSAPPEKHMSS